MPIERNRRELKQPISGNFAAHGFGYAQPTPTNTSFTLANALKNMAYADVSTGILIFFRLSNDFSK